LGPAGFAWLRALVAFPFLDRIVWMGFWEEASELALVLLVTRLTAEWVLRVEEQAAPDR
jgi:hypothetical protein